MGCDYPLRSLMASQLRFNPRTHMGCDMMMIIVTSCSSQFQSTHPHGVRHDDDNSHILLIPVSIHAPTWGATPENRYPYRTKVVSIHAPTWGATAAFTLALRSFSVSIHAPTWGATQTTLVHQRSTAVSIHAPTWGATAIIVLPAFFGVVSIHAPTWGATL